MRKPRATKINIKHLWGANKENKTNQNKPKYILCGDHRETQQNKKTRRKSMRWPYENMYYSYRYHVFIYYIDWCLWLLEPSFVLLRSRHRGPPSALASLGPWLLVISLLLLLLLVLVILFIIRLVIIIIGGSITNLKIMICNITSTKLIIISITSIIVTSISNTLIIVSSTNINIILNRITSVIAFTWQKKLQFFVRKSK